MDGKACRSWDSEAWLFVSEDEKRLFVSGGWLRLFKFIRVGDRVIQGRRQRTEVEQARRTRRHDCLERERHLWSLDGHHSAHLVYVQF